NADYQNLGGANDRLRLLDAIVKLEPNQKFNIWAGRFLPPGDRANFSGPYFLNSWDYPFVSANPAIFAGRDNRIAYWGQAGGRAASSRATTTAPTRAARCSGRAASRSTSGIPRVATTTPAPTTARRISWRSASAGTCRRTAPASAARPTSATRPTPTMTRPRR